MQFPQEKPYPSLPKGSEPLVRERHRKAVVGIAPLEPHYFQIVSKQ